MPGSVEQRGVVPTPDDSETQAVPRIRRQRAVPPPEAPEVTVIDTPLDRVRHPGDLLAIVVGIVGVALILVLATYAHGTTEGVTQDVQSFGAALRRILAVPINFVEALATLILPALVITELVVRRAGRQVVEVLFAWLAGLGFGWLFVRALEAWGSDALLEGVRVTVNGNQVLALSSYVVSLAAMLTAAGRRGRRRTVTWSWNALWVAMVIAVITGGLTLPGALLTLLVGRVAGLVIRYAVGVHSERAYGQRLVEGIRRAGVEPVRVVRVHDVVHDVAHPGAAAANTTAANTSAANANAPTGTTANTAPATTPNPDATQALDRTGDFRVYAVTTATGERRDAVVLDADRQVLGFIARTWQAIRLRGLDRRGGVSLRQSAERTALLSYSASNAGVRTPHLLGFAEIEDSMVLLFAHPDNTRSVRDLTARELTAPVLDDIWNQVKIAHRAGLAHRSITADVVLVDDDGKVWFTAWGSGDVASTELARRMDLAQTLAMLALRIGPANAVAAAARALTVEDLEAIGPLLQSVVLPRATREEARAEKKVLQQLRDAVVAEVPSADVEPVRLVRFGMRTVLMLAATVLAGIVIVTSLKLDEIIPAVRQASPWWALGAFAIGLGTYFGAALALMGFAPIRLPLWRTTLVQAAASFVNLVAPAGVGPAALNLRFLTKHRVTTPLAVATVALVQVGGFTVTVLLLLCLSLVTGSTGALSGLPTGAVLMTLGIIAVIVAAAMVIPNLRQWIWRKIGPTLHQTWPRLVDVLGRPKKLAMGIGGNIIVTIGYVAAFGACLAAFGHTLPLLNLALVYLVANTVGSAVPTPGGVGAVEASLTLGLQLAGIDPTIAFSTAILYRLLTYWARVPLGWVAMQYMQRTRAI